MGETNDSLKDIESTALKPVQPPPNPSSIIANLDATIASFGDGHIFPSNNNDSVSTAANTNHAETSLDESILKKFSPPGLEEPFRQLHSILFPALYRASQGHTTATTPATPTRTPTSSSSSFRNPVSSSSAAILMGVKGSGKTLLLERVLEACQEQLQHNHDDGRRCVLYRMVEINGIIDKHILRLRRATFNSNLALLESTLKLAAADDIPILLNLDELDSFTDEGERQMLLYHFLDRVATPGSNLILVGMTSSFSALTLLEKRIRSRAEGTAKIIYLRTPQSYRGLLEVLEYKLNGCVVARDILDRLPHPKDIESRASEILPEQGSDRKDTIDAIVKLSVAMEREFRLGRDIRWFSRVIATSLSLCRHDYILTMSRNGSIGAQECNSSRSVRPEFCTKHLWDAMLMMGASIFDGTVASRQPDFCIVDDAAVSPRLQALLDLSTPQVALLLSARRILKREEHREQVVSAPLTMERMLKEYESFRRGSNSTGDSKLLKRAAWHLMQQGLLVPSIDHSGGGALHYFVSKIYRTLDHYTLSRLPLHIPFEIDRELGKALEQNLLECPTALKEWGKCISKAS
eukprot:jgi/Psemu1/210106/e_gw1.523.28.1